MPNRTSNSSVNSSIRQNTVATNEGFTQLLQLQKSSNEYLQTIQSAIAQGLSLQRDSNLTEIVIAKQMTDEEDLLKQMRDSLQDIAKSLRESVTATIISAGGSASSSNASTAIVGSSKEDKNEAQRAEDERDEILRQIEKNTRPGERNKDNNKDKSVSIGKWLTALAVGLGAIVGAISGYVKAIVAMNKVLFSAVESTIVALGKFFPSLKKMLFAIETNFVLGIEMLKEGFSNFIQKALKVFNSVKSFFAPIIEVFTSAIDSVRSGISGLSEFFTGIGSKLGMFGKIFKSVFIIFEKLAIPLTVIMAIWDTVKGAFEGFEKGGLVGAISGAISGLINSIIGAPLDLLKSAVSWILGAFGFDKAEKFLDSFSFEDLIKDFFDAIFAPLKLIQDLIMHPIDTIKKMGEQISNMLQSIGIPEISFTIPIIDKKVSIGPFYPFKKEQTTSANVASNTTTVTPSNTKPDTSTRQQGLRANVGLGNINKDEKLKTEAAKLGIDPNNANGTFEAGELSSITDKTTGKVYPITLSADKQASVNAVRQMRADNNNSAKLASNSQETLTASSVAPSQSLSTSNIVSSESNSISSMKEQKSISSNNVVAPTINNNMKQTQIAKIEAPVRNCDSSLDRYFSARSVY
jgi:hypothetical protein